MKNKLLLLLVCGVFAFGSYFYFTADQTKILTMKDFREWRIEQKKNKKPNYGYPDKAMQWYYEQRAYPLGYIPEGWRQEAMEHIQRENLPVEAPALSWMQLGPGNIGGRVRAIVVHPTNPNLVYIGAVSGGVWRTTDGGSSWAPLKDNMENLAVCSMVMDPTNPNIIYAGTGEGFFNGDAIRGEGIFKTTDGGATWSRLSSTNNANFYYVNKLIIDNTTNTLWAATRKGLFRSNDGGNTFTGILVGTGGADVHCTDIEISYTSPPIIYAAFGIFQNGSVYRSTDGGNNFTLNLGHASYGRIEIATSKSNPAVAYVSIMNSSTNGIAAMGVTTDWGSTWNTITTPGPTYSGSSDYAIPQAWYDNIIYVDPDNPAIVYAGGIDFWKSTNSGTSWVQKSNWYPQAGAPQYVHADQHAIAFAPSNSSLMYLGNDGGMWKSTNKGENWSSLNNGLYITQFYYGAVAPTGAKYYGGTQDNGTIGTTGSHSWTELLGGDGGATEVDFVNPNNIYMEYVNFAFFKSTDAGASFFKAMNGIPTGPNFWDGTTDRTLFITPFSMDPNNSSTIVGGTYRVWRTINGAANWTAISGDLTGDGSGQQGARISTVIIAKGNSNVIYVGCTNGRVQVSTDGGANWNLRNSGLPNAYITRIATDPSNPAIAYVTFSGFTAGSKVYRTADYGVSWTNISSNLPNLPVNCVIVHPTNPNSIYVGTDLGVFTTTNGGTNWFQDIGGMANVSVHDLDYRSSDNRLFAATHGRSMYSANLSGAADVSEFGTGIPEKFELSHNYPNPFNPSTSFRYSIPDASNVKVVIYDINGVQVAELVNQFQNAGFYELTWNGTNDAGNFVSSGTYFYSVRAGNFVETKKMLLVK